LSPFCRQIRLALAEKGLLFELKEESVWPPSPDFLSVNPAGTVPVLIDDRQSEGVAVVTPAGPIGEYLEEVYPEPPLLPKTPVDRAECRRLVAWFNEKFHTEVTLNLLFEKVHKRYAGFGAPDMDQVREGVENIHSHLDYISRLADDRRWLAGDDFTLADLVAAAHISSIDYLGDVPWWNYEPAKVWYVKMKSRPSFRPLLKDRIPGVPPPRHYGDLDF
jgi:glutathione S-transferase